MFQFVQGHKRENQRYEETTTNRKQLQTKKQNFQKKKK